MSRRTIALSWHQPDLTDQPLDNPDLIWFTDGRSFVLNGQRKAEYTIVSLYEKQRPSLCLPEHQLNQLSSIALSRALELAEGKKLTLYTDSKYGFLILHAHVAIWRERGYLTTKDSPVKYKDQVLRLLEAVQVPQRVAMVHCKGHQQGDTEIAKGNRLADQAAKQVALRNPSVSGYSYEGSLFPLLISQQLSILRKRGLEVSSKDILYRPMGGLQKTVSFLNHKAYNGKSSNHYMMLPIQDSQLSLHQSATYLLVRG